MAKQLTKGTVPEQAEMIAAILETYHAATKDDVIAGTVWYDEAQDVARDIAAGTPFDVNQIAGVLSAISPRMPWGRNKTVAREIVARFLSNRQDFTGLAINANVNLAVSILMGSDPGTVLKNKRLAFYRNIAGDPNAVTVDVWAVRAATRNPKLDGPGNCYTEVADAYGIAADMVRVPARVMQAVVWVTYRRHAVTEKHLECLNRDSKRVGF